MKNSRFSTSNFMYLLISHFINCISHCS